MLLYIRAVRRHNAMKQILISFLLFFSAIASYSQDFIELSGQDTVFGEILEVSQEQLKFRAEGHDAPARVTLSIIVSYRDDGEVHRPQEQMMPDIASLKIAEKEIHIAGDYLVRSTDIFYAGGTLSLIGLIAGTTGAIIMSGSGSQEAKRLGEITLYVGGGLLATGSIVTLSAFIPIRQSGLSLKGIRLTR